MSSAWRSITSERSPPSPTPCVLGPGADRAGPRRRARPAPSTIRRQASEPDLGRVVPAACDRGHRGHARHGSGWPRTVDIPTDAQRAVAAHAEGPLLVVGAAGSGRTEALALRLEALAGRGTRAGARARPDPLARGAGAAARARRGCCSTARTRSSGSTPTRRRPRRCCASTRARGRPRPVLHHGRAGRPARDPARPARRAAAAPPRDPRQPGRPAGAAAAPRSTCSRPRRWRRRRCASGRSRGERAASTPGERERAEREIEFADLYARHDRILREAGSLDGGDLVLELGTPARATAPTSPSEVAERFGHVLADELEDAGLAHRAPARGGRPRTATWSCACDPAQATRRFRGAGEAPLAAFRAAHPGAAEIDLGQPLRVPGVTRFWRCENERAQAQAVAREIEHLLAAGEVRPERICVIAGSGWREGRLVAGGARGAQRAVPLRRRRGVLPAPRGPRRARLAADARRPQRRGGGRPRADPAAGRAALGRPGEGDDDRPAPQARHGLGARGGAREPAAAARGPRPDPDASCACTAPPRTRSRRCAPTSSSAG